jgi:hypothetical protein
MRVFMMLLCAAAALCAQPRNANVLFDGANLDQWALNGDPHWKIVGRLLEIDPSTRHEQGKCRLATRENFGDVLLHVEFLLPLMADQRGQARANSGVFLQGRYEVQILDSFGNPPTDDGAGALYRTVAPRVNACLPPGKWQTYDIDFRAARFEGDKLIAKPRITVLYNGVKIHDNVELQVTGTPANAAPEFARTGPILLQNHRCPVRFLNIWMVRK